MPMDDKALSNARAAVPLGGIGTGNASLGSRGELRDWELKNHPDKGRLNLYNFFAIHAPPRGGEAVSRMLEGRLRGPHDADEGYAVGEPAGLPRFDHAGLTGAYPFAWVDNHYARSMASWGLLLAYSGVQFDAPRRSCFFSARSCWGRAEMRAGESCTVEMTADDQRNPVHEQRLDREKTR